MRKSRIRTFEVLENRSLLAGDFSQTQLEFTESKPQFEVATSAPALSSGEGPSLRVVSILPTSVNESAGFVAATLTLDNPAVGNELVWVSVIDDTAVLGSDYSSHIQPVAFSTGQTNATVRFAILDDNLPENAEAFYGYLIQPNNLILGTRTAKITINDDDGVFQPRLVTIHPATVNESAGTVNVRLTLDQAAIGSESVGVSVIDGTAVLGLDYMSHIQTITFATGQTEAIVQFNILNDNVPENSESFYGHLIQPNNLVIGTPTGKITIDDDDGVFQPRLVTIHPATVNESAGTVNVKLTLDQAAIGSESVGVSVIDGTAVLGLDYMSHIQTITFATGQTEAIVQFNILNDNVPENSESFYGHLIQPNNLVIGTPTGKITINDDDGAFQPRRVTIHPTAVNESARTVDVRLTLDQAALGGESVRFSVIDGSAILGSDYLTYMQTVTFVTGQTGATVRIDIIDDLHRENTELFYGYLFEPNNLILQNDRAAISVEDNQGPLRTYHSTANFRLPNRVHVNIGGYNSLNEALAAQTQIDWRIQTTNAKAITLAFAAKELVDHLNLAGVNVALNTVQNNQPAGIGIYLLTQEDTAILSELQAGGIIIQFEKMHEQGFVIVDYRGSLYLIGKSRIGTLYAAYALLERLGFKWLSPSESIIPNLAEAIVPSLPLIEEPHQRYRGFWTFGDTEDGSETEVVVDQPYLLWMARNRLNIAGSVSTPYSHLLGVANWGGGHHVIRDILDSPELFTQHPEWYGQLGGARVPIRATDSDFYVNPNFANEQMIEYFSQVLLDRLIRGDMKEIEVLSLWPSDSRSVYVWDGSAEAIAIGNRTDNLLNFYAGIAERLTLAFEQRRINRLVTIAGIAYFTSWDPPTNRSIVTRLERLRNFIQIFYMNERSYSQAINDPLQRSGKNQEIINRIAAWHQSANLEYGVVEYINYSIYSAVANTSFQNFANDFAYFSENAGTFFAYTHANRDNIGPRKVTNRLIAQLSWKTFDPSRFQYAVKSAESVINEYFAVSYGNRAAEINQVYLDLATASSNVAEIANYCNGTIFQDMAWIPPPLTAGEANSQLSACLQGGRQSLRDLPFENVFVADFVGIEESLTRLIALESRVIGLIDNATISLDVRERLRREFEWIVLTRQRYQLIRHAIDYRLQTTAGSPERILIVQQMNVLIEAIVSNPITADTLSRVNQREGVFGWYRRLT